MIDELRLGIYRHYKGPLYQVLGLGHDANADTLSVRESVQMRSGDGLFTLPALGERIVVVYIPLQLDGAHLGPRLSVRTLDDFLAWVPVSAEVGEARMDIDLDCGAGRFHVRYRNDVWEIPRFEFCGQFLTAEMLA